MGLVTVRAAIKAKLDLRVTAGILGAAYDAPQDAQKTDFAPTDYPVAEIHYLKVDSKFGDNRDWEMTYYFAIVCYIPMDVDTIDVAEKAMDVVMDDLLSTFANYQTLGGTVQIGAVPAITEAFQAELKGKTLYGRALVLPMRDLLSTD